MAAIGWATRQPLIFASLGPTAYELVELPQMRSARAYNIVVGHLVGLGAGFLGLYLLNAWAAPNVLGAGIVSSQRLGAVVIAATLTTLGTLLLKASQPASLATTLLVSLGAMQTRRDALAIIARHPDHHSHRRTCAPLSSKAHQAPAYCGKLWMRTA